MFKNNPLFFIFFFSTYHFAFEKLCFAENTIKIVFSEKTQLFKNTVSKTHFFSHVKKTFFKETVSFLVLGNFRWNHYFYSFSWFTLFWSKKIVGQNRSCARKCAFFSLPDTNSVRQFSLKIHFFLIFHIFGWPPFSILFVFLFSVSISPT